MLRIWVVDPRTERRERMMRRLSAIPGIAVAGASALMRGAPARPDADLVLVPAGKPLRRIRPPTARAAWPPVLVYGSCLDDVLTIQTAAVPAVSYLLEDDPPDLMAAVIDEVTTGARTASRTGVGVAVPHKLVQSLAPLLEVVEERDPGTSGHLRRVALLAYRLARRCSLAADPLAFAGFALHDIGKLGVPDAILFKPGPLNEAEWAVMRRHPVHGAAMMEPLLGAGVARDIILHHHERWDGSGYPSGLRGEEIPVAARVFAVVDAYDAMTSDRPYRAPIPAAAAVAELYRHSGTQFAPDIVRAFDELLRAAGQPAGQAAAWEAPPEWLFWTTPRPAAPVQRNGRP